jgi:CRP-like cAMP-binding protein
MLENTLNEINKSIALTQADRDLFQRVLIPKKLRRKQLLSAQGDICQHIAFVNKGCLRSFVMDKTGIEHVVQFAIEGGTISDLTSFLNGSPANCYIEALEDSELLLMDKSGRESLMHSIPQFEKIIRGKLEENVIAHSFRVNSLLCQNAQERYITFINMYPKLVNRIPQHLIASYLGITPSFLSRIRTRK